VKRWKEYTRTTKDGVNVLFLAIANRPSNINSSIIDTLLKNGADYKIVNDENLTIIDLFNMRKEREKRLRRKEKVKEILKKEKVKKMEEKKNKKKYENPEFVLNLFEGGKKKKKDAKLIKELLVKFNNFEIRTFRIGDEDYLRLNGHVVETSQGVKVPIADARKLFKAIKAGHDVVGHKIAAYTVNSLNGTLTIGCHRINMESVHLIGEEMCM
jgi:hypothetical protein